MRPLLAVGLGVASVAVGLAWYFYPTSPARPVDCEELKKYITYKIGQYGPRSYTLETLPIDAETSGKKMGVCENGTKKIIYHSKRRTNGTSHRSR